MERNKFQCSDSLCSTWIWFFWISCLTWWDWRAQPQCWGQGSLPPCQEAQLGWTQDTQWLQPGICEDFQNLFVSCPWKYAFFACQSFGLSEGDPFSRVSQPSGIGYLRVGSGAAPMRADLGKRPNCSNTSSVLDLVKKEIKPGWKCIFTWTQYQGLLQLGGQGLGRQDGRMGRCKRGRGNTEKISSLLQHVITRKQKRVWEDYRIQPKIFSE